MKPNVPPDREIRAALVGILWAVRALPLSRRDARRAALDAAVARAERALRERRPESTGEQA
jgi:hypothetical protein